MKIKIAKEAGLDESKDWVAEFVDSEKTCRGGSPNEALGKLVRSHMAEFGIDEIQFGNPVRVSGFSFGPTVSGLVGESHRRVMA